MTLARRFNVFKKRAPFGGLFELRTLRVIRLRHVSKALHVPVPLIAALGRFALSPTRVRSSVYNISARGWECVGIHRRAKADEAIAFGAFNGIS